MVRWKGMEVCNTLNKQLALYDDNFSIFLDDWKIIPSGIKIPKKMFLKIEYQINLTA